MGPEGWISLLVPQPSPETGGRGNGVVDGAAQCRLCGHDGHLILAAGDAGVEQLAGEDSITLVRQ